MVVRPAAQWPVLLAFVDRDRLVVDAGKAHPHQAVGTELPVLVAVRAVPVAGVVAPLVGKAHGQSVLVAGPQLLDETVIQLLVPLAGEELDDLWPPLRELGPIAPAAVDRVSHCHPLRVAAVP